MDTSTHFLLYLAQFFLEWEMFQTEIVEEIKIHILYSTIFFSKIFPFMRYVEKYFWAGQATDDNMAHAYCLLDTWGYKHTLIMCNTYFFSTATVFARTPLNFDVTPTLSVLLFN